MCADCAKSDLTKLDAVFEQFKGDDHALISILQRAQAIYGYLPTDVIYRNAEKQGVSPAKVLGVATFYSQFRFAPAGKYRIQICKGTACYVNGSERLIDVFARELGIHDNETTDDGLFSLNVVSCLGCCSLAPVMMINDRVYGLLTPEKIRRILRELRKEAASE